MSPTQRTALLASVVLTSACGPLPSLVDETLTGSMAGFDLEGFGDDADAALSDAPGGRTVELGFDSSELHGSSFDDLSAKLFDLGDGAFITPCVDAGGGALCAAAAIQLSGMISDDGELDTTLTDLIVGDLPPGIDDASISGDVQSLDVTVVNSRHLQIELVVDELEGDMTIDFDELGSGGFWFNTRDVTVDAGTSCLHLVLDVTFAENTYDYPWPEFCGAEITDASEWSTEAPDPAVVGYQVSDIAADLSVSGGVGSFTVRGLTIFGNGKAANGLEDTLTDLLDALDGEVLPVLDPVEARLTVDTTPPILARLGDLGADGTDLDYYVDWDVDGDVNSAGDVVPDGFELGVDNCPFAPNPAQSDLDMDGVGDACDTEYIPADEMARVRRMLIGRHCLIPVTGSLWANPHRLEMAELLAPPGPAMDLTQYIDWGRELGGLGPWIDMPLLVPEEAFVQLDERLTQVEHITGLSAAQIDKAVWFEDGAWWVGLDLAEHQDLGPDQWAVLMATMPIHSLFVQ